MPYYPPLPKPIRKDYIVYEYNAPDVAVYLRSLSEQSDTEYVLKASYLPEIAKYQSTYQLDYNFGNIATFTDYLKYTVVKFQCDMKVQGGTGYVLFSEAGVERLVLSTTSTSYSTKSGTFKTGYTSPNYSTYIMNDSGYYTYVKNRYIYMKYGTLKVGT
jgi:hypothetical protein